MLCGELLNGGTAVPCGLLGLWIPGCVRETSPRLSTSPYLPLLVELLASGYIERRYIECQTNIEDMDLIRHNQMNSNCSTDLDLDLDNDDSAFLGESLIILIFYFQLSPLVLPFFSHLSLNSQADTHSKVSSFSISLFER